MNPIKHAHPIIVAFFPDVDGLCRLRIQEASRGVSLVRTQGCKIKQSRS